MKKNVASQSVGIQMITISDGSNFTGTVTLAITKDNGTQTGSAGTAPAHEGNGYHSYSPTQAETNADHIAFTFSGTGAITSSVQVFTSFPQTVDNDTKISLIPTTAMRGTDSAATSAKQDTMETTLNAIPTTAMRGTDNAATSAKQDTMETTLNAIPTTPMRGTDGANTVAPDNTSIAAILVDTGTALPNQISGLNNITAASVWSVVTRELTSGTNIVLAKGTGLTGLNDISTADILSSGDIDGFSIEESLKLIGSSSYGKLAGAATTTVTIQAADDSKARITASVDSDGNRDSVTLDASG